MIVTADEFSVRRRTPFFAVRDSVAAAYSAKFLLGRTTANIAVSAFAALDLTTEPEIV